MAFWTPYCTEVSNSIWKPTLTPSSKLSRPTNSWYKVDKSTFKIKQPQLFSSQEVDDEFSYCRKIRIKPNAEQRAKLNQWWNAYRFTYNKTVESMIKETDSKPSVQCHLHVETDYVHVQIGYRAELTPHLCVRFFQREKFLKAKLQVSKKQERVSLKINVFTNNQIGVRFFQEYPNIQSWLQYRNNLVIIKNNSFIEKNSWLKNTYKTIRASACKDACSNYKTIQTLCKRYFKNGTVGTQGFKSKRAESWSIGMEAINIKPIIIKEKPKNPKKKRNRRNKKVKNHYVEICDLGLPVRCREKIKPGFGDPKIHKDVYGDYYLLLPYKDTPVRNKDSLPTETLDAGIKSIFTGYNTIGETYHYVNDETSILRSCDKIDNLVSQVAICQDALQRRRLENKLATLRKRQRNRIDDMHWKIANDLTRRNNEIVIGKFNVQNVLESSTITKAAKRKLSCLSIYRFKQRLYYKASTKGVKVTEWCEKGTTKTCPCCGTWNSNITLSERTFRCKKTDCNYTADRDEKAACCIYIRYLTKI